MVVDRSWECECGNRNDDLVCAKCGNVLPTDPKEYESIFSPMKKKEPGFGETIIKKNQELLEKYFPTEEPTPESVREIVGIATRELTQEDLDVLSEVGKQASEAGREYQKTLEPPLDRGEMCGSLLWTGIGLVFIILILLSFLGSLIK